MEIFSKETMEIVGKTLAGLGDNAQNAFIAYLSVPVLLEVVYWVGVCFLVSVVFKGVLKIVASKPNITIKKPQVSVIEARVDSKLVRELKLHRDGHVEMMDGELYRTALDYAKTYIVALEGTVGAEGVAKLRRQILGQLPEQ